VGDFPAANVLTPTHITSWSRWMSGPIARLTGAALGNPASMDWIGANTAIYIPFRVPWPYPVKRAFWVNGATVTGNSDIGIYSRKGARLWSSGSTAQSGASALQYVTASGLILSPDTEYVLGFVNDGTTTRAFGATGVTANLGRFVGLYQQATALPLPASATYAAWASIGYPLVGITRTASGF
jgi:hypothetical protein